VRRGFTLIELMTALAIVGVLSGLTITEYRVFHYKVKRQEAYLHLDAIVNTQYAYSASYDQFTTAASNPGTTPNNKLRDWNPTMAGWTELGFVPDGAVRCNYETLPQDDGSWFRAEANCDIDHNGQIAIIRYDSTEADTPGWTDLYPTRF